MNDEKFDYTYSAPTDDERREIESIKKQYEASTTKVDKLEELRSLDRRVTKPPFIVSLILGIVGTLIMGLGMTMVLEWNITAWGVIVGLLGVATAAVAYPVHKVMLKHNKSKYGQRIVELSDELLNKDGEQ